MNTSTSLEIGKTYTRDELAQKFGISDATLKTGIFQPKGSKSIWLFVTERKTSDRTPYKDLLSGDTLEWDGQATGRKDQLIIEHAARGLELLLFYRKEKYEFAHAAFRYEGHFMYESHAGSMPAHFVLRRVAQQLLELVETIDDIRDSMKVFNGVALSRIERATALSRSTTYWVYDPDTDSFGPSKFVGFASITFERYQTAIGSQVDASDFHGTRTRQAIERILGSTYREDPTLEERLTQWADSTLSKGSLNGVASEKWKFLRLPSARSYWAFLANPKVYRILHRLNEAEEDYWRVGDRKVKSGDRFVLWKAAGGQSKRGVIALGEVLSNPEVMADPGPKTYWIDKEGEREAPRVRVRYVRPPLAPLWLDEDTSSLLGGLSVARATGGSIFNITSEQWEKLVIALGGWEESSSETEPLFTNDHSARTHTSRGQGRQISAKERKAIERRAVDLATAHFSAQGFEVEEWGKPFDLLCIRGEEVLYVEVKGTKGRGESIILTANEVRYARERSPKMALFIVHGIETEETTGEFHARGGEMKLLRPWTVDDGELTPSQYDYVVPGC